MCSSSSLTLGFGMIPEWPCQIYISLSHLHAQSNVPISDLARPPGAPFLGVDDSCCAGAQKQQNAVGGSWVRHIACSTQTQSC